MSHERERDLLDRFDEELQKALDVAPSSEFLPRVRARVAGESAGRWPWTLFWLVPVAASLVVLISVVWLRQPSESSATQARRASSATVPAVSESPRPAPEAGGPSPERSGKPIVQRPRVERSVAEREILVPADAEELLRSFVAGIQTGRLDATALAAGEVKPPDLAIAPLEEIPSLEVKPLTSSTDSEGVSHD